MSSSEPLQSPPDGYVLYPLSALDGILIYVTKGGEHVGTYFGTTELAATAAVAAALTDTNEVTA